MFSYQIQLALISQYLNDNTTTLIKTNWNSITFESEGKKKRKKKKEIYAKDRNLAPWIGSCIYKNQNTTASLPPKT